MAAEAFLGGANIGISAVFLGWLFGQLFRVFRRVIRG